MLKFAKENLDNAQAAYDATLEKYNAGKERIAELSIALRQIVNARVRYSDIHSKYLTAIANLAFATGALIHFGGQMYKPIGAFFAISASF